MIQGYVAPQRAGCSESTKDNVEIDTGVEKEEKRKNWVLSIEIARTVLYGEASRGWNNSGDPSGFI